MPHAGVTVYDLLLSCPGDVMDLKDTVDACVKSFNASIGEANNIRIELKHWSTDGFSQSGDKPQNILNKQFVDDCDLCIALLGIRFGTPTDNYDSGTEEEIEKMLLQKKQVFLYFVERSVNLSEIDMEQYKKVQEFKDKYTDKGVYTIVKSAEALRTEFQNALTLYFIKLVAPNTTQLQPTLLPNLVISSTKNDTETPTLFHTNYQRIKLVKDKETAIMSLIDKISLFEVIPSVVVTNDENESEISDEQLQTMTVRDILEAAENKQISTIQFHKIMGTEPPICSKVELNEAELDLIFAFCSQHNLKLDDGFYSLGNLHKEIKKTAIAVFGNRNISYSGSESEKEKYNLLKELLTKIREYNQVMEYFGEIDDMHCLSLMVENTGNTYDEDIDIKLFIEKECIADIDRIPEPGKFFLEEAVDLKIPELLFAGHRNSDIEDYSNYPINTYIAPTLSLPFKSREEEISEQREEYQDLLEYVFCYDLRETDDEDVLCFNIPYLKQNTKMFFPSYLFFISAPKNIRYEIRSKYSPEVYKGILKIIDGVGD